ncbi:hypothetical protein OG497_37525 [Streptomyces sp. NBC_01242]|uniref:hypothetical protein n=1 Tax=Streptomyces sp. NBC_01242 TaxID=2903795 RepID=UPI002252FAC0|nr:hypothetical protein [Streptomyces sp. NBC_01242]MCX4799558.1 hypothetical protein [Streptomyces sp. NBC_01242]
MTLVWSALPVREAAFTEHLTPEQLVNGPAGKAVQHAKSPMGAKMWLGPTAQQVGPLADSIKQHGYQPDQHGHLHLNRRNDGWESYHASGHESPDHPLHGASAEKAGIALVRALHESGHSAPVPVHVQHTDAPQKAAPVVHHEEPEPDFPGKGVTYYHGTIGEHGTDDSPGEIHPATVHGQGVTFRSDTSPDHAYATTSEGDAWDYAGKAFDHRGTEGHHVPKVYQVRATGPVEKDPDWDDRAGRSRNVNESDHRSKHPFEIVREMDPPEHIRDHYYPDHR